jgi:hypothetical protein
MQPKPDDQSPLEYASVRLRPQRYWKDFAQILLMVLTVCAVATLMLYLLLLRLGFHLPAIHWGPPL